MKKLAILSLLLIFSSCDYKKKEESKDENDFDIDSLFDAKMKERKEKKDSLIKARRIERDKKEKEKESKIDNALSNLRVKVDKATKTRFYFSKKFYHYNNSNNISVYIARDKYDNISLRFKISYYSDNSRWIFFKKFVFAYDGNLSDSFIINDRKTGVEDFKVWEYADISVSEHLDMTLDIVSKSKNAKIFLIGNKNHERVITKKEKIALRDVIQAYYNSTIKLNWN